MCDSVVLYNCLGEYAYCTTVHVSGCTVQVVVLYNCLGEWLYCTIVPESGCTVLFNCLFSQL